ncbi:linoleate 13S-lipoxygenase 3-1, chloroplastic-like protein [Tanacetum coccineum]
MLQSTKYMDVVDTLSTHSPDEEYIGERKQRDTWSGDAEMVEAFYGIASEIQKIEKEIEKRNRNMSLKNRCGAGPDTSSYSYYPNPHDLVGAGVDYSHRRRRCMRGKNNLLVAGNKNNTDHQEDGRKKEKGFHDD